MRDLILYGALAIYVLYITYINNMWGLSKGTKKARNDVRVEKKRLKKRAWALKRLAFYHWVALNIGASPSQDRLNDYKYKLDRLRWKVKVLNRPIDPIELVGILRTIQLVAIFMTVLLMVLTKSIVIIIFLLLALAPLIFRVYATAKIADEDEKLERDFPDFFTILYSRLIQGTNVRLAPTLNDYLLSLDTKGVGSEDKEVIRNFVRDLRSNIELYGDDGMAVTKLRDKYHSVMVINFCNIVVKSLSGVNSADKLLSFKLELNNKQQEYLDERANKLVARGSRAVMFIWLILFQFVLLSWIAKLSNVSGISAIFGG